MVNTFRHTVLWLAGSVYSHLRLQLGLHVDDWMPRLWCISACRGATLMLLNSGRGPLRPGNAVTKR